MAWEAAWHGGCWKCLLLYYRLPLPQSLLLPFQNPVHSSPPLYWSQGKPLCGLDIKEDFHFILWINFSMSSGELNKLWNRKVVASASDGPPKAVGSHERVRNEGGHTARPAFWTDHSGSRWGVGRRVLSKPHPSPTLHSTLHVSPSRYFPWGAPPVISFYLFLGCS